MFNNYVIQKNNVAVFLSKNTVLVLNSTNSEQNFMFNAFSHFNSY